MVGLLHGRWDQVRWVDRRGRAQFEECEASAGVGVGIECDGGVAREFRPQCVWFGGAGSQGKVALFLVVGVLDCTRIGNLVICQFTAYVEMILCCMLSGIESDAVEVFFLGIARSDIFIV